MYPFINLTLTFSGKAKLGFQNPSEVLLYFVMLLFGVIATLIKKLLPFLWSICYYLPLITTRTRNFFWIIRCSLNAGMWVFLDSCRMLCSVNANPWRMSLPAVESRHTCLCGRSSSDQGWRGIQQSRGLITRSTPPTPPPVRVSPREASQ